MASFMEIFKSLETGFAYCCHQFISVVASKMALPKLFILLFLGITIILETTQLIDYKCTYSCTISAKSNWRSKWQKSSMIRVLNANLMFKK